MESANLSRASKYIAAKYDKFYSNSQAEKENVEIKRLFNSEFDGGKEWLDVGCGTGFGYTIMPAKSRYIGVDIDSDMIYACNSKHKGMFVCGSAEQQDFNGNILSIFSVNYFSDDSIKRMALQSQSAFVVFYNKPYMNGSASAYCGKELEYRLQHAAKSKTILSALTANKFMVFGLLNEPFYYVGVKNGKSGRPATRSN